LAILGLAALFLGSTGCGPAKPPNYKPINLGERNEIRNWDDELEADFEIRKVIGQWKLARIESGLFGMTSKELDVPDLPFLEILKDRCRFTFRDDDEPRQVDFLLVVNLERSPKQFELASPGDSIHGAFKLLTDGRLVIAFTMDLDADRQTFPAKIPSSLNAGEPNVVVVVLKRVESPH
jgi:hypothetical protein